MAELKGVMEKENAVFGILITVHKPTDGMLRETSITGLVDVGLHHFPKIQIWTISNFFSGIMPKLP